MADVEQILDRLEYVRPTGSGRWMARCPAHTDGTPSLSVRQLSDQRILLHCFGGCGALDVLDSIGLEWADLFPPDDNYSPAVKRREKQAEEEMIVAIAESDVRQGKRLSESEKRVVMNARLRMLYAN